MKTVGELVAMNDTSSQKVSQFSGEKIVTTVWCLAAFCFIHEDNRHSCVAGFKTMLIIPITSSRKKKKTFS